MTYNSDDQRTLPGALQGLTAQKIGSSGVAIANSNSTQAAGTATAEDTSGRPGYLAVGQPGGSSANVLVPGGEYSSTNQIQTVAPNAGTAGGFKSYPGAATNPVANPMITTAWSVQTSTSDDFVQMIIITAASLTGGTHNVAYAGVTLAATGGDGSNTWSVVSGSALPAGLSLNTSTGAISGTPTTAGTYNFLIKVVDTDSNQAEQRFTIVIA